MSNEASEVYAETYRQNAETLTPAAFAQHAAAWRAHFKDFTITVDELFSCGDRVITRITSRGTHIGDFWILPATGRSFELTGIDIFEFAGGRVVQHWHETDHLEMFQERCPSTRPPPDPREQRRGPHRTRPARGRHRPRSSRRRLNPARGRCRHRPLGPLR